MFGLRPTAPTRPEDYSVHRAGRPLRNTRLKRRGLTPRRLAQLAGIDPRGVQRVTPDPWISEPALVLSDVVAGPEPWMGMLLDTARPQPLPIGSLNRSTGTGAGAPLADVARRAAAPGCATRGAGWQSPRSVAAYWTISAPSPLLARELR